MTEAARVPASTWLAGPTFLALERSAAAAGHGLSVELAIAADERAEKLRPAKRYAKITPALELRIAELYDAGMLPAAIAREVGCSRASVYNHLPPKE